MVKQNTTLKLSAKAGFHERLHVWYAQHGRRDLPWRNTDDAYAIWVSEVMLQQTQVPTVLERYYFPFLDRFPTVQALASAPLEAVLKVWQGLGYYTRAANLHKAAKLSGGALPQTVEGLVALPGIGRNTAHAVAAFAYRQPVAVMEANVKRVLCRIFALEHPDNNTLWEYAEKLLDKANPFDYNQAMMDIGAMVCTRKNPKCSECPARDICNGKYTPMAYPSPKKSKQARVRSRIIFVLWDEAGRIYASPRDGRFLQGLYQFVEVDASSSLSFLRKQEACLHADTLLRVRDQIPAFAGMTMGGMTGLGSITQVYSHFTLEAEVYLCAVQSKQNGKDWHSLAELRKLPHSKAEEKILALLLVKGEMVAA